MKIKTKGDVRGKRVYYKALVYKEGKLTRLNNKLQKWFIETEKVQDDHLNKDVQINTGAALSSIYICTRGYDVGLVAKCLGVPGGTNCER